MSIVYKEYAPTLAATVRLVVQDRAEIQAQLEKLGQEIPADKTAGAPFCIFHFITSVQEGHDVTLGWPVTQVTETAHLQTQSIPERQVLSILHRGSPETIGESAGKLFAYANRYAIISDEFYREVYLDATHPDGPGVEIHFMIHDWNKKLSAGLKRVLGQETAQAVMAESETLEIESGVDARFEWVKGMLERLSSVADDDQRFDILSGCAHVFPVEQIAKLTAVFDETRACTGDPLQAVDAVIAFMDQDPGWGEGGRREGYTIYTAKNPRDPKAYAAAQTDLERRQAYCFCPLIRSKIDQGMPVDFCYCGSGWARQQWEGATGKPVRVEVLQSVLRGDEKCEFAVHLSRDI